MKYQCPKCGELTKTEGLCEKCLTEIESEDAAQRQPDAHGHWVWERVRAEHDGLETERLKVAGGYIYRSFSNCEGGPVLAMVFVPGGGK